jgi:hypothetical protein
MTASSNSVRSIKHQPNLNELSPNFPACVIEFFEARQRLLTDSKRIAHETEIDRLVHESAIRRGRYVGVPDTVVVSTFQTLILSICRIPSASAVASNGGNTGSPFSNASFSTCSTHATTSGNNSSICFCSYGLTKAMNRICVSIISQTSEKHRASGFTDDLMVLATSRTL